MERCALGPGNVHSAHGWQDVLEPVVARYRGKFKRRYVRAVPEFIWGMSDESRMLEFQHVSYNRPDARYAKQWQKALRPKEIRLIEGRIAALLQDRGYEKSGLPALRANAFQAVGLALQNRIARNAFAIRRYGIALWAGEKTARWFRLKSRWALYKKEIDAIDTRYLK